MKIHQLPMGARFEFEGEEYVKTGPMVATGKSGQRFFPKYAVLKPLGDVPSAVSGKPRTTVSRAGALKAFEVFYAECSALVPEDRRKSLDSARARFLRFLDGPAP